MCARRKLLKHLLTDNEACADCCEGEILSEVEIETVLRQGGDTDRWSVADVALMDELQS